MRGHVPPGARGGGGRARRRRRVSLVDVARFFHLRDALRRRAVLHRWCRESGRPGFGNRGFFICDVARNVLRDPARILDIDRYGRRRGLPAARARDPPLLPRRWPSSRSRKPSSSSEDVSPAGARGAAVFPFDRFLPFRVSMCALASLSSDQLDPRSFSRRRFSSCFFADSPRPPELKNGSSFSDATSGASAGSEDHSRRPNSPSLGLVRVRSQRESHRYGGRVRAFNAHKTRAFRGTSAKTRRRVQNRENARRVIKYTDPGKVEVF